MIYGKVVFTRSRMSNEGNEFTSVLCRVLTPNGNGELMDYSFNAAIKEAEIGDIVAVNDIEKYEAESGVTYFNGKGAYIPSREELKENNLLPKATGVSKVMSMFGESVESAEAEPATVEVAQSAEVEADELPLL